MPRSAWSRSARLPAASPRSIRRRGSAASPGRKYIKLKFDVLPTHVYALLHACVCITYVYSLFEGLDGKLFWRLQRVKLDRQGRPPARDTLRQTSKPVTRQALSRGSTTPDPRPAHPPVTCEDFRAPQRLNPQAEGARGRHGGTPALLAGGEAELAGVPLPPLPRPSALPHRPGEPERAGSAASPPCTAARPRPPRRPLARLRSPRPRPRNGRASCGAASAHGRNLAAHAQCEQ